MKEIAKAHLVVARDLRGFGDSAKPESGYDKKTMAHDVHALAQPLSVQKAGVTGHDIGLKVTYAYAAQYPSEVERLALMDAFIPGLGDTTNLFLLKDLWHSTSTVRLRLVEGGLGELQRKFHEHEPASHFLRYVIVRLDQREAQAVVQAPGLVLADAGVQTHRSVIKRLRLHDDGLT